MVFDSLWFRSIIIIIISVMIDLKDCASNHLNENDRIGLRKTETIEDDSKRIETNEISQLMNRENFEKAQQLLMTLRCAFYEKAIIPISKRLNISLPLPRDIPVDCEHNKHSSNGLNGVEFEKKNKIANNEDGMMMMMMKQEHRKSDSVRSKIHHHKEEEKEEGMKMEKGEQHGQEEHSEQNEGEAGAEGEGHESVPVKHPAPKGKARHGMGSHDGRGLSLRPRSNFGQRYFLLDLGSGHRRRHHSRTKISEERAGEE
ncbi:hypothetical protein QR98_0080850 [Sarcoptes scabiei]|uniref:Uncharacterized protein n=1 Tax=Sarcoptes scabiei TaxID=52283 RepID=A0A132AEY3_SARSC|nr:hypothetical protein QR98_0080850 [Sarcoptes scabiei]